LTDAAAFALLQCRLLQCFQFYFTPSPTSFADGLVQRQASVCFVACPPLHACHLPVPPTIIISTTAAMGTAAMGTSVAFEC